MLDDFFFIENEMHWLFQAFNTTPLLKPHSKIFLMSGLRDLNYCLLLPQQKAIFEPKVLYGTKCYQKRGTESRSLIKTERSALDNTDHCDIPK